MPLASSRGMKCTGATGPSSGLLQRSSASRPTMRRVSRSTFGTGYSSLAYLARLPVQTLKIDRSFIHKMLEDDQSMTLVQTIISLGRALSLTTVAEGVELAEQADLLEMLRCDQMQGYLVSRPLPVDSVTDLLRAS
jgi:EAL domain-containing protein (putative c-di-GMP-specific phosphodiesterase class I)